MEFFAVLFIVIFTVIAVRIYDLRKNKVSQKGDIPFDASEIKDPNKQEN
jgi:hypothetical protein